MIRKILLSICIIALAGCAGAPATIRKGAYGDPVVRVAVARGAEIKITGKKIAFLSGSRSVASFQGEAIVKASGGNFLLGGKSVPARDVHVAGDDLAIEGKAYRGDVTLIAEGGEVVAVNHVGLEHYLFGLINHEISSAWPIESVKAQAVAARSYAYRKITKGGNIPYHMESTVLDQVYGGKGREDDRAEKAVNDTRGEVIYYNNEVANALYHSTCGGTTASADEVWGKDIPYLSGITDPYCTEAPNYFWSFETNLDELAALSEEAGIDPKGEPQVKVIIRTRNGRAAMVSVGKAEITGDDLREMLGYDRLKSTLFNVETDGSRIAFTGSGSGHGVGMCQWGAKGMAEEGKNYREILQFYYRGIRIGKAY